METSSNVIRPYTVHYSQRDVNRRVVVQAYTAEDAVTQVHIQIRRNIPTPVIFNVEAGDKVNTNV